MPSDAVLASGAGDVWQTCGRWRRGCCSYERAAFLCELLLQVGCRATPAQLPPVESLCYVFSTARHQCRAANNNHHHLPAMATATATTTETVWHRYSEPREAFGYAFPPAPSVSWWLPTITVHKWLSDGQAVPVWAPTTLTRWEVDDYIRRAQRAGYSIDAWDACPTCLSQQRYACGPCTPLTCAIGRPLRGAAPRYR